MSIYQLKPTFQNFLRPVVNYLAQIGITANQITVMAILLSILTGLGLWVAADQPRIFLLIPFILFLRMALNAIDGMLAREHHMKSRLGAILNEMGDVLSDTALYLPFAFIEIFSPTLVVVAIILAIFTEMIGVVAVQIDASRRYDGPLGKSDRAFVFSILAVLIAVDVPVLLYGNIIWTVIIGLLCLTIINRGKKALQEVS